MASFRSFSSVAKFSRAVTLNPSAIPAASVATETFSVPGLKSGQMIVLAQAAALEAGVTILASRASADDELELTFQNSTVGEVNPASQTFMVIGL